MIYDARTNPRGFGLRIDQWPKDAQVRRISRMGGYRIPSHAFTAPDATPARALLNHGVWRAWCPDCPFAAEDVWRGHNVFWCMRCGNLKAGRAWRPLIWPDNLEEIEAILADYPAPAQNWEPWGVPVDLKAEADAWVEHAAAMVDPEHGLSDNEAGGEDDPETYTTPVLAVTNAIIASSDANVDKGDIRYFRQFLSANPSGSGYLLTSTGTDAAGWSRPSGDTVLTPSSVTGNSGTSAIGTGAIHGNRMVANSFDATQVAAAFATGAFDATNCDDIIAAGAIAYAKLASGVARIATGTYAGNDASGRQITTGFQCKFVVITMQVDTTHGYGMWFLFNTNTSGTDGNFAIGRTYASTSITGNATTAALHASDGFVVDVVGLENVSGVDYSYVAFG